MDQGTSSEIHSPGRKDETPLIGFTMLSLMAALCSLAVEGLLKVRVDIS